LQAIDDVRGPLATDKQCRGILGDLNDVTFYAYQPPPPPNDVTFHAYQLGDKISIDADQNNVTIYAYQLLPSPNDATLDAYQPNNIAINAYQV
jgi:hypothetical protein